MILANIIPGIAMIYITKSIMDEIWNANDRVIITIPSLKAKPLFGCKKDKKTEVKSIDKQEIFCVTKQTLILFFEIG